MNIRVSMVGALPAMLRSADETPRERRTHPGLRGKHQAAVAMLTGWLAVSYSAFALIRYYTLHIGSLIPATLAARCWVYDSPETPLMAQGVLFALAIPPLWIFTRWFSGDTKATVALGLIAVAYGLRWPIAAAMGYDFHKVAFTPVHMAVAPERLQAGRLPTTLIALAVLPRGSAQASAGTSRRAAG